MLEKHGKLLQPPTNRSTQKRTLSTWTIWNFIVFARTKLRTLRNRKRIKYELQRRRKNEFKIGKKEAQKKKKCYKNIAIRSILFSFMFDLFFIEFAFIFISLFCATQKKTKKNIIHVVDGIKSNGSEWTRECTKLHRKANRNSMAT